MGSKTAVNIEKAALVDVNTSLLCQLHSHQQRHELENEQFDLQSPSKGLKKENDWAKTLENEHNDKNTRIQICAYNTMKGSEASLYLIL